MCVDRISESLVGFDHEGVYYKVSMVWPGTIFLYTEDELLQTFSCPANIGIGGLATYFKNEHIIRASALNNAQGETDKEKFISEVKRLISEGVINNNLLEPLSLFIRMTNSPPETVKKQLILKGFGNIGDLMNFGACTEDLLKNCEVFKEFLKKLQKRKRHAQEVTRNSPPDIRLGNDVPDGVRQEPDRSREEQDSEKHPFYQDDHGSNSVV